MYTDEEKIEIYSVIREVLESLKRFKPTVVQRAAMETFLPTALDKVREAHKKELYELVEAAIKDGLDVDSDIRILEYDLPLTRDGDGTVCLHP